ncbi:MAG: tetratricopeptide repeat protein [Myxococcota bacterium]
MADLNTPDPTGTDEQVERAATLIEEGRALLDAGDLDGAIQAFDEATGLDEMNGAAWNDLAVALFQGGKTQMAIGCLYTALRADPTFADAAINLATLLDGEGRPADGIPGLRGVLFHDPEHEDVREVLQGLGVTQTRAVAIVAAPANKDTTKVIDACLTEWNHLVVRPNLNWVSAMGSPDDSETWTQWIAAIRPATIIIDPEHPAAAALISACKDLRATPTLLGVDLPEEGPLVDLAQVLTSNIPQARETWDDVPQPAPPVSVITQVTHLAHTINLLDRLAAQDLPPGLFEVIAVDRAYGTPATSLFQPEEYGFDTTVIRMEGAGVATARQAAVDSAKGTYLVFFDEESRPHTACVGQHLATQTQTAQAEAVLGAFRVHPNLIDNSLRKLIDTSNLLYAQPELIDGTVHGGAAFRANNISVPKADIVEIGGFDPLFSAGCDDTDLGIRLESERGIRVRYDASIGCDMDYPIAIGDLQVEQLIRGWACVHLAEKHDDPRFLVNPEEENLDATWFADRRLQADRNAEQASGLAARIQQVCTLEEPYRKTGAAEHFDAIIRVVGMQAFNRGIAIARSGFRLEDERLPGSLSASPTPVIVRSGGDITATLGSLAATEAAVVAYVSEDVQAPAGLVVRRGGLEQAMASNAAAVAFIDAGTTMPPGWVTEMLSELEQWPDFGAVAPRTTTTAQQNRPVAAPALIVAREAIDRLGDAAWTAINSAALPERLAETGYRMVRSEVAVLSAEAAMEEAI